jgi:toxin ParE1/3/4
LPRLVFTDAAVDDLEAILRYLARSSGQAHVASRFVTALEDRCAQLAGLPGHMGVARPELGADIRSAPCKGYVVFFRYSDDCFEVINILERHRDFITYFGDENTKSG